jgi:hypothetical protein
MREEFSVDSEGWLSECSVQELATWYHSHVGRVSELTFEAHLPWIHPSASAAPVTTSCVCSTRRRTAVYSWVISPNG